MNYGGFGGYEPRYNDPLSSPGGMRGMAFGAQPTMGMNSGPPGGGGRGPGAALGAVLSKGGDWIGEGMDWLTDEDKGANRINAILGLTNIGAGLYGAHQQGKREDREYEQSQEDRERQRSRQDAADPYRTKILQMLTERMEGR